MPNIYRMIWMKSKRVGLLWKMGLKGVWFLQSEDRLKDNAGTEALNPDGLMQRAIQTIKATVPEMVVFPMWPSIPILHLGMTALWKTMPSSMTQPLTCWHKWHSAMHRQSRCCSAERYDGRAGTAHSKGTRK